MRSLLFGEYVGNKEFKIELPPRSRRGGVSIENLKLIINSDNTPDNNSPSEFMKRSERILNSYCVIVRLRNYVRLAPKPKVFFERVFFVF